LYRWLSDAFSKNDCLKLIISHFTISIMILHFQIKLTFYFDVKQTFFMILILIFQTNWKSLLLFYCLAMRICCTTFYPLSNFQKVNVLWVYIKLKLSFWLLEKKICWKLNLMLSLAKFIVVNIFVKFETYSHKNAFNLSKMETTGT